MLQCTKYGNVQHLNLGLERLRCFGSALTPLTSLVELHAQSNCLTSLSGQLQTRTCIPYVLGIPLYGAHMLALGNAVYSGTCSCVEACR